MEPDHVARALMRAVSRFISTPSWATDSLSTGRRHECRRGTHECVRHMVTVEWSELPA